MKLEGSLHFKNGLIVDKLIETLTLNHIALENILRKTGNQTIAGLITIAGNVNIEDDVTIKETINRVEITYMLENFELGEETLLVKGEVLFNRLSYIQNLTINGLINGQNFSKLKNQFAYKDQDIHLMKNITFNNTVQIKGNLWVKKDINGIVLSDFVPRVVWLTKDAEIKGPIRFVQPVECYKYLKVENELSTALFLGKNLQDVINEGVFIDRGLLKGSFQFETITIHEDLKTKFINSLDMDTLVYLKTPQQLNELDIAEMSVANDFNVGNNVNEVNLMVERDRTLLSNVEQYVPSEIVFLKNVIVEEKLIAKLINKKPTSKIVTTNTEQNLTALYNFNSKTWSHGNITVDGLINEINLTSWKGNIISSNSEEMLHIKQKWHVKENLNLARPLKGQELINGINMRQLARNIQERELYLCDIETKIINDFSNICKDITYLYKHAKHQIYKFKYFEELETLRLPNQIHFVKHFQFNSRNYLLINEKQSCFSKLMEFNGREGFLELNSLQTGVIDQIEILNDKEVFLMVTRGSEDDNLSCNIRFSTVVWRFNKEEELEIVATHESQELLHKQPNIPNVFYGLKNQVVTEFKINVSKEPALLQKYKKWNINEDNARFIPFGNELTLATDKTLFFLGDFENIADEKVDINIEATIVSNFTKKSNNVIPRRGDGEIAVVSVGVNKKKMLALAGHKESQVEHRLDVLEIYSNPFTAEVFDKLSTYRPLGLTSIDFNNGETLLAFMENRKILQIYEYKGIEGFKHRSSIKIQADQIVHMDLGFENVLGLIYKNKITFLQAVMAGNRLDGDDLNCEN
ncbi:unnamed protein product [Ceutorhynchus assimilis]|uniref:Uncharacterized protein n=1 Tax=Ceutorhynchus assimilis TaxID=467358 RepID=A0A9N9MEG1_9CUCU|nr:unnamed protein product [Ceutorhynchus assimilis]